jgi:hypothetical protein
MVQLSSSEILTQSLLKEISPLYKDTSNGLSSFSFEFQDVTTSSLLSSNCLIEEINNLYFFSFLRDISSFISSSVEYHSHTGSEVLFSFSAIISNIDNISVLSSKYCLTLTKSFESILFQLKIRDLLAQSIVVPSGNHFSNNFALSSISNTPSISRSLIASDFCSFMDVKFFKISSLESADKEDLGMA